MSSPESGSSTPTNNPGPAEGGSPGRDGKASPPRRPGRSVLTAVLALATIAVAAGVIYWNWPDRSDWIALVRPPARPGPSTPPPPAPTRGEILERAAARSRLAIVRAGRGDDLRTVVVLGKPTGPRDHVFIKTSDQSILGRELVRQAVLIAARDELGLATRDEVLDEVPPPSAGPPAEVTSVYDESGRLATVRRGEGAGAETLLSRGLGSGPLGDDLVSVTAIVAEELSRRGFPEALKSLGASGVPAARRGDARLPAGVEERLSRLGFIEHIAALRDIHAAIRADGESDERVGALARGYAQLGVLSEFQWHPAHKAYKARALLYAQRLAARDPSSGGALAVRAFVKALVGFQREALEDAARARALEKSPPAWLGLIEAYAGGNATGLAVEEGQLSRLASLLRLLSVEYPPWSELVLRSAKEVIAADPRCYRAHDTMCRVGGVQNLHFATVYGPDVLTKTLAPGLKAAGGLPASVGERLRRGANELDLVAAMTRAAASGEDLGEPSWGALSHLVRETRFIQAYRRLHFMTEVWSVPVGDYWEDVRPFVADHRYRPFLETRVPSGPEARKSYGDFVNNFDPTDLDVQELDLTWSFNGFVTARLPHDFTYIVRHSDATARDFSELTLAHKGEQKASYARQLLKLAPGSAFAMASLVESDWPKAEAKVAEWAKAAGESATLLGALGKHYSGARQYDRATEALGRYIRLSPDYWAFEMLAENARARGDLALWKSTLEGYLAKGTDHGLDFAKVRVELARHYIGSKDWDRAKRYADAAAESWAQWAMTCAAEANEGAGDWEQAELWTRRVSERYPDTSWANWYLFCKRTGRGGLDEARAWTGRYLATVEGRPDLVQPMDAAHFYWSDGSPKMALGLIERLHAASPAAASCLHLALIRDELGDGRGRDEEMAEVCRKFKGEAPKTVAVCEALRGWLADPAKGALDLRAVDDIIASIPDRSRWLTEFFVGKFLLNHGQVEAGRRLLGRAAISPAADLWKRVIIADALDQTDRRGAP